MDQDNLIGGMQESPGGFMFGVQGWDWGPQRPSAVTFFLNGTAKVSDQHGRPIKGVVNPETQVATLFDQCTHAQTVAALMGERVDVIGEMNAVGTPCNTCKGKRQVQGGKWCPACHHKASAESTGLRPCLIVSGWPQLPYKELQRLKTLPQTPIEELRKIKNAELRKDALRIRREHDEAREKELVNAEQE